ncbi:MAG TPA: gamma-glutamyltransferase [Janthinobacterium sp.]|nr:gamma-glutamyltransferase [Janthinobacterium sp.]
MTDFDWNNPYPSIRRPLFARNVVATSQPLAAQAGLRMLQKGGNAVDAAIAAAAAITIVEPVSCGLGSDAFALIWDGTQLHGLNASGPAPAAWTPDYFRQKHNNLVPERGWDAVTVPGAVAGWAALSQKFGKLPFADLLEPAIELAERGYMVSQVVQQKWEKAVPILHTQPGFAYTFMPRGRAPHVGEQFVFAEAGRSLRKIAETKGEALYRGELAAELVSHARAFGGAMSLADLAAYQPEWVTPITKDYAGYTVHEIPPNGQGIAALIALGILDKLDITRFPADSVESRHLQIEAMKLAFADTYKWVADERHMTGMTVKDLLDDGYLSERARLIDEHKATRFSYGTPPKGGTIYLSAADESGMMVSFIQSNYMGFGSGVVVPGTGISLQNRGHSFNLSPRHPNCVAPGKRPFHTIIPGFLTKGGQPQMAFGVMGGNMQPQGHMQTLVRMLDYRQSLQAACDAPRWRFNAGLELNVEQQMDPQVVEALRARGHRLEVINDNYQDFGAGQFIWRAGDPLREGYIAASDSRRDGLVAGF